MIGDAADVAEARRAAREGERPRRQPARFVNRQVPHDLTPVTDALLADPPPGDWLSWRRTRNSHGYSPLDQVTRDNVDQLQLAWVLAIREGRHQTTPLVHEGVMFLANPGSVVQAIDATTGDVIWQYRSPLPEDAPQRAPTRTLALYGDKVFLATADAALVALDARTGEEAWRTMKADYAQGFRQNAGPVIADGVVVTGTNGCQRYKEQMRIRTRAAMVRDRDPLQNLPLVDGDAEEVTVNEPTSAEWVIGEWVTLDRELHPFEALELATVIEAVKLHVLHGWPRWWAWTFASLVAEIAIGILEAAAGELVIVDHDVGETIH